MLMAVMILTREHIPAAISLWPMFDFTDPIRSGSLLLRKIFSIALHSLLSPTDVPCKKIQILTLIVSVGDKRL